MDVQQLSRRGFIRLFGYGAPAAIVAPKYFFAPPGGWISQPKAPGLSFLEVDLEPIRPLIVRQEPFVLGIDAKSLEEFLAAHSQFRNRYMLLEKQISKEMCNPRHFALR